jgi:hypothetical protein
MIWGIAIPHIIMHATALAVVGFLVAFAAQHAAGWLKCFGKYLSWWLFLLAIASIVCGVLWHGQMKQHAGWMMMHEGAPAAVEAPAPAPAPAPAGQ